MRGECQTSGGVVRQDRGSWVFGSWTSDEKGRNKSKKERDAVEGQVKTKRARIDSTARTAKGRTTDSKGKGGGACLLCSGLVALKSPLGIRSRVSCVVAGLL